MGINYFFVTDPPATDKYQGDNASDCDSLDGPGGKLASFKFANRVRLAAIFPSENQIVDPSETDPCGRRRHHCSMQGEFSIF